MLPRSLPGWLPLTYLNFCFYYLTLASNMFLFTFMHWRRKWHPTPVFLTGGSQGWAALWAAASGVTQSRTRLKRLRSRSSSNMFNIYAFFFFFLSHPWNKPPERGVWRRSPFCQCVAQEKAMAPHSSTLAWKITWTEEPGRLQSMGSQRVGHDRVAWLSLFTFMHGRRKWQPTPVFLPGESQGRGSLVGCRLWGRSESDTTEGT